MEGSSNDAKLPLCWLTENSIKLSQIMALWWWHFHLSLKSHTFARISGSREDFSNKKSKTYKIIRVYCLHRTRTNLFNILILIFYTHLLYWWKIAYHRLGDRNILPLNVQWPGFGACFLSQTLSLRYVWNACIVVEKQLPIILYKDANFSGKESRLVGFSII